MPVAAQTLPHNIPDFSQDSSRPTVRSVDTGRWATAATWQGGQVPTANHVVHVDPNHIVTIDTDDRDGCTRSPCTARCDSPRPPTAGCGSPT